jgi:hypothetical protein
MREEGYLAIFEAQGPLPPCGEKRRKTALGVGMSMLIVSDSPPSVQDAKYCKAAFYLPSVDCEPLWGRDFVLLILTPKD